MKNRLTHVFAAGALAAGLVFAQTQVPAPEPRQGRQGAGQQRKAQRFERLAAALNLTPEQRDKAKALMQEARTSAQPVMEQLRANRRQMAEAVKTGNEADIERLATQKGVLAGQLAAIHAKAMQRGYAMLTPEQRQKADELRGKMMDHFSGGFGPRR